MLDFHDLYLKEKEMIAIAGITGNLGCLVVAELLKSTRADQIVGIALTLEKSANLVKQGMNI